MLNLYPTPRARGMYLRAFRTLPGGGLMSQVWRIMLFSVLSNLPRRWRFTGELRFAARTLFDAGITGLTNEETISLVDRWQYSCKVFSGILLRPVMATDCRQPISAFFASRLGKKVPCCCKSLASLRFHCRWSIQSTFHKVFPFSCSPNMRLF